MQNIDRHKFVLDGLFLKSKLHSTHINAVRRTKNDWMLYGLHRFSMRGEEHSFEITGHRPQDLLKVVSPNTGTDRLIAHRVGSLLPN
jgi:hypothetical protein